jgi:hypothetical protein
MAPARSLRDLLVQLTGGASGAEPAAADPAGALGAYRLPDDLVAEAVVNYADSAPIEVAEHLAPLVTAHSGIPGAAGEAEEAEEAAAPGDWFALLATAPATEDVGAADTAGDLAAAAGTGDPFDLDIDFGAGADLGGPAGHDHLDAGTEAADHAWSDGDAPAWPGGHGGEPAEADRTFDPADLTGLAGVAGDVDDIDDVHDAHDAETGDTDPGDQLDQLDG